MSLQHSNKPLPQVLGWMERRPDSGMPPLRLPPTTPCMELPRGGVIANRRAWSDGELDLLIVGAITSIRRGDGQPSLALDAQPSEPEVAVARLYRELGTAFASRIDGQFLIILYDRRDSSLHLVNDAWQARNLYYYLDDGHLVFASRLATLLEVLPTRPPLEPDSVPSFLSTGFSASDRTAFQNIYHLLPAHSLKLAAAGSQGESFSLSPRWRDEYRVSRRPFDDLEATLDTYEQRFSASIEQYLTATGSQHPGCLLSGGHDTSMVFIHTSKLVSEPVHAFTVSFPEWGFDESPKARYVTEKFGGVHHRVDFGPQHLDFLPQVVDAMEEPSTSTSLPLHVCAREVARYSDAMLSGDGGDTLWDEYYPISEIHRYLKYVPTGGRRLLHTLARVARDATDWERLWELEHVLELFTPRDMYGDFFRRLLTYRHYRDDVLRELLDPGVFPQVGYQGNRLQIPVDATSFAEALIEAKLYYGVYQYLVPHAQKAAEAAGIGFHSPWLNRDLIHFVGTVPRDWLNGGSSFSKMINDAYKRRLHKQVMLRYLPARFVFSQQQSFDVPYQLMFARRPRLMEVLHRRLEHRGWYDKRALDQLFGEFRSATYKPHEPLELKSHAYRIFTLLTLETWCTRFLDGRLPDRTETPAPLEDYLA